MHLLYYTIPQQLNDRMPDNSVQRRAVQAVNVGSTQQDQQRNWVCCDRIFIAHRPLFEPSGTFTTILIRSDLTLIRAIVSNFPRTAHSCCLGGVEIIREFDPIINTRSLFLSAIIPALAMSKSSPR